MNCVELTLRDLIVYLVVRETDNTVGDVLLEVQ